jgi:hypothetical protein
VVEMTRSASIFRFGSEFDDFLFAPIGEERDGMLLTVLSVLARLDLDPWQEAAELARLPGKTATQRLTSLIAALPDGPSVHLDPETIAARLIQRLPRRAGSNVPSRETLLGIGAVINSQAVLLVVFMAFVLAAQFIMASRQPPAQSRNAHAPASSTVIPQIPPPSSGSDDQVGWRNRGYYD